MHMLPERNHHVNTPIRAVSYGGGVQSTALLVLAAQRRIDFPLFLMANVGEDSEHPDTLTYVREVAAPFAAEHGIELVMLDRVKRDGTVETLWSRLMDRRSCSRCKGTGVIPADPEVHIGPAWPDAVAAGLSVGATVPCPKCEGEGDVESRSLPIPVRMSNGAPGNRSCTADFKIKVIGKELKRRGAHAGQRCKPHRAEDRAAEWVDHSGDEPVTKRGLDRGPRPDCSMCTPPNPATVGVGISLDEAQRANSRVKEPHEVVVYPLISVGEDTGLRLNRGDCERIIREAGLPVPPKSSCFFCPFHRPEAWDDLAREHPELYEKSVHLEDTLNERRAMLGKDSVYLTRFGRPLREVTGAGQDLLPLLDDDGCDSGWCFR